MVGEILMRAGENIARAFFPHPESAVSHPVYGELASFPVPR
jgi:hypothetical protein